jgi:GMP synthase (glutamine-hydrolysing)
MEITKQGIAELIKACPDDLKAGKFVQSQEILLHQDLEGIHQQMRVLLDRLTSTLILD